MMTVAASDFDYIARLVWRSSAIVLEPGKEYLVESRLLPLVRQAGAASISELVNRLQSQPDDPLLRRVVDAMTTNETSWFRDRIPFDALGEHVLPELLAKRSRERSLNIWSAGCSTGQEPYSIAMVVAGHMALRPGWTVRILGTDLSEDVLAKARRGAYGQLEVNRGLPAAMLVTNFDRVGMEWQLKPALRSMVEFSQLNLAMPFPSTMPRMDVVFLRNVLIYFDAASKRQVLQRLRGLLRPDGYLILGGAETTLNLDDAWEPVQFDRATCYRLRGGKAQS